MQQKPQQNHKISPERESRVAEALRENLRKRKMQQQIRDELKNKEELDGRV